MIKKKLILPVACWLLLILLSGCSPISVSDEQRKEIISADPAFENVLKAKNNYDTQLAELRQKLAAARREFELKRTQFYSQAQQIKALLDPQREKIKAELAVLYEDYRNKLKSQKAIKGMLAQAKSITEGKFGANLTGREKEEWSKRFGLLNEEYDKIAQEVKSAEEKIYILKLKQRSLIQ